MRLNPNKGFVLRTPYFRRSKYGSRTSPLVLSKSPIGKAINYATEHYDRLCRYVIDGRFRIDTNLVENGQRHVR